MRLHKKKHYPMINIFVDQNVIIDIFLNEITVEESIQILDQLPNDAYSLFISAKAIVSIGYLIPVRLKDKQEKENIKLNIPEILSQYFDLLFSKFCILDINQDDILKAYSEGWRDFEDAVEEQIAQRHKMDIILTSNIKDFKKSKLKVYAPKEFLKMMKSY
jgi:predicted nucleic-acid-binding protein